jgi:hypothetical protein
MWRGFAPGVVNHKKVHSTQTAIDNLYQLLAHGRWLSRSTPTSSTTKTGRHDIAEILLKVAFKHQKSSIQSIQLSRRVVISLTGLTPQHF